MKTEFMGRFHTHVTKDEKGRKVSNGIYYYMVKPEDGEPYYGKIAVIR